MGSHGLLQKQAHRYRQACDLPCTGVFGTRIVFESALLDLLDGTFYLYRNVFRQGCVG
jgi:hypothetical protein